VTIFLSTKHLLQSAKIRFVCERCKFAKTKKVCVPTFLKFFSGDKLKRAFANHSTIPQDFLARFLIIWKMSFIFIAL